MGPWHGELGFEALYWLPWLKHWRDTDQIAADRLVPITRGGMSLLYDAPKALELYDMRDPRDVRVENWLTFRQTGWMKQAQIRAFDREVLRDAAKTLGLGRTYHVLHPAWLYQTLQPFFAGERGIAWLQQRSDYRPIPAPVLDGVNLPPQFTAVRFYFRPTFPPTPQTIAFAKATITHIAQQMPVMVLTSGQSLDDHIDYLPTDRTNVTVLAEALPMKPAQNLAVQAAVLGKAAGFVGTYGGFAQLALRLGKPVLSVYDQWQATSMAHLHLSHAVALQQGTTFHAFRVGQLPAMNLLPKVVAAEGSSSKKTPDVAQPTEEAVVA